MKIQDIDLAPAEYDALLEIIRRDLRGQSRKSQEESPEQEWHRSNSRLCKRLLELFNPKRRVEHRSARDRQERLEKTADSM
jgi:hypothetical protein